MGHLAHNRDTGIDRGRVASLAKSCQAWMACIWSLWLLQEASVQQSGPRTTNARHMPTSLLALNCWVTSSIDV
jgi:hypothetical protein